MVSGCRQPAPRAQVPAANDNLHDDGCDACMTVPYVLFDELKARRDPVVNGNVGHDRFLIFAVRRPKSFGGDLKLARREDQPILSSYRPLASETKRLADCNAERPLP